MSFSRINLAVFGLVLVFAVVIYGAPPRKIKDDDTYGSAGTYGGGSSDATASGTAVIGLGTASNFLASTASGGHAGDAVVVISEAGGCDPCVDDTTVVAAASGSEFNHGQGIVSQQVTGLGGSATGDTSASQSNYGGEYAGGSTAPQPQAVN